MLHPMKRLLCLILALCCLPLCALGETDWLMADSDTRLFTEAELWLWDYESLGYILNEIYARRGYHFPAGSAYETYFKEKPWYVPHTKGNNLTGCLMLMNDTERANSELAEQVLSAMRVQGTTNAQNGRSLWDEGPVVQPLNFTWTEFKRGQLFKVFSYPSTKALRTNNKKASVSTNDDVWTAGFDGDWLLVLYETNGGSMRVGYIDSRQVKGKLDVTTQLEFAHLPARITAQCDYTDDPALNGKKMATLKEGTEVTYLTYYFLNDKKWAYIEAKASKKQARGFVPIDCVEILEAE